MVELLRHLRMRDEIAHQYEQRDDRQGVGQTGLVGHLRDHRRRDIEVDHVGNTGETNDTHGERHRHAQKGKRQEGRKPDQCFEHELDQ